MSGHFSLVIMTPDFHPGTDSRPDMAESYFIYKFIFLLLQYLVPGDRMTTATEKREDKSAESTVIYRYIYVILKQLIQIFYCSRGR